MTEETTPTPPADGASPPEDESLGDEVTRVVESAAELGLGAVIAPFTGGETVSIVGSVASMLEAGVDRLTHLGEHETPQEPDADRESTGEEDGDGGDRETDRDERESDREESDREDCEGGDRESDREDSEGGDRESDREDGGAAPAAPGRGPDTNGQATDGRG